jgi:hypothetical protein
MRTWKWQACTSNFYQLARFSRATSVKVDSGADQESSQTKLLQRFGGCPLFDLQTPDVLETPTPAQVAALVSLGRSEGSPAYVAPKIDS